MLRLNIDLTCGTLLDEVAARLPPKELGFLMDKVGQMRASEEAQPHRGYPDPGQTAAVLAYLLGRCLRAVQTGDVRAILPAVAAVCRTSESDLLAALPEPKHAEQPREGGG